METVKLVKIEEVPVQKGSYNIEVIEKIEPLLLERPSDCKINFIERNTSIVPIQTLVEPFELSNHEVEAKDISNCELNSEGYIYDNPRRVFRKKEIHQVAFTNEAQKVINLVTAGAVDSYKQKLKLYRHNMDIKDSNHKHNVYVLKQEIEELQELLEEEKNISVWKKIRISFMRLPKKAFHFIRKGK